MPGRAMGRRKSAGGNLPGNLAIKRRRSSIDPVMAQQHAAMALNQTRCMDQFSVGGVDPKPARPPPQARAGGQSVHFYDRSSSDDESSGGGGGFQDNWEVQYMSTLMDNLDEYQAAFIRFSHGGEHLPLSRLGNLLRYLGLNPTEGEVEDLKNETDQDQNGFIDMHEFLQMIHDQFATQNNDEQLLHELFGQLDTSGRGCLRLDEMMKMIEQCKIIVGTEKDHEDLIKLMSPPEHDHAEDNPIHMKLSWWQKLKAWIASMITKGKDYYAKILQQLSKNPPDRDDPDSSADPDVKRNVKKVKKSTGEEHPTRANFWLTRSEIEEMVREFDTEGQGMFDIDAFIKAWHELYSRN